MMATEQAESIRSKAWAIYNADIKHLVEPEHKGKYLVLNVETGDYEIDRNLAQAGVRMLERFQIPRGEKPPFFGFRIGYPATFDRRPRIKGTPIPPEEWPNSLPGRAHAIYDAKIKHLVEPEHHGKYLVMHMETHEYEIDVSLAQAGLRMLERFQIPKGEKPPFFGFRIGYPTTYDARA